VAYAVYDSEEPPGNHQRADLRPVRNPTAAGSERGQQLRLLLDPDEIDQADADRAEVERAIRILTEAFPGAEWVM